MKKYKFFALAFAALTLGACSSDDVVDNGQGGIVPAGEPGYVSLAINLPTQPSSRANDDFSNGEVVEYKVNNAYLFLFAGSSEASATYQSGYVLPTSTWNDQEEGSNITTYANLIQEITKPAATNSNIYALVVLNGEGVIESSNTEGSYTFTYGGNALTPNTTLLSTLTSTELTPAIGTIANRTSGNFLMSNAPLFNVAGGTNDPSSGNVATLAVIDPTNIYSTRAEAETNEPAANIYVERAVAKVTIDDAADGKTTVGGLSYEIAGWDLDVTNKSTYLVRNVGLTTSLWGSKAAASNDYRFVGSAPVGTNLYRTYWGIDPNYNGQGYQDEFNMYEGETYENAELKSVDEPLYCLENTFNVENMRQNQTTQIIVAADFTVDDAAANGDFYTLRGDKGTFLQEAGVIAAVKDAYLRNQQIDNAVRGANMVAPDTEIGAEDLTVTFDQKNTTGGYVTVTEITLTDDGRAKFADTDADGNPDVPAILEAANNDQIVSAISDDLLIALYKGGRAYYHAMIRHFDDTQTPWDENAVSGTDSYGNPANEANYLGRWGVLRNNWYQISVTSIAQLGEPEVPTVPGDYDDPTESWIRVQINVLSWAVRRQNADL